MAHAPANSNFILALIQCVLASTETWSFLFSVLYRYMALPFDLRTRSRRHNRVQATTSDGNGSGNDIFNNYSTRRIFTNLFTIIYFAFGNKKFTDSVGLNRLKEQVNHLNPEYL